MLSASLSTVVTLSLLSTISSVVAGSTHHSGFVKHFKREVPQEHSHEQFITTVRASLQSNNPRGISDPIFGLLGNKAAAGGANGIDPVCLQQATADQAFTNAKSKNDVNGMTAALVYRALERNTPGIGNPSTPCVSESAKNPEIAALTQHQDPAAPNAAAINKASTLALAVQIAKIGGDPQIALKSGTFAPGSLSDNSGRGNTCDDQNDPIGCIFTQNKIVFDASAAEIIAAVGGKASPPVSKSHALTSSVAQVITAASATAFAAPGEDCIDVSGSTVLALPTASPRKSAPLVVTITSTVTVSASTCSATSPPTTISPSSSGFANNLQKFTGALGGILAPAVAVGGRGFVVDGEPNSSALRVFAALQRSCSIQHNKCANFANGGKGSFSVGDCDQQNNACQAA